MDILIKSFNRPYYLDKCIQSILKFVTDSSLKIIILDDGTPEIYLKKISDKYPMITILKSEYYQDKQNLITSNSEVFISKIPIRLWLSEAAKSTDYFMLLEDDIWFTKPLNINELNPVLRTKKSLMLKMFWLTNSKLIPNHFEEFNGKIKIFSPKLLTKNKLLYKIIFMFQRFKINQITSFLKLNTEQNKLNYYHIYSTAGVIFNKKYFLNLWHNHNNEVDENLQIKNAIDFLKNNKNSKFAHLETEILKTGFASAATNAHKNYQNIAVDMFAFNKLLNQAWLNDQFVTDNNFEKDLNAVSIENILQNANNPKANSEEWKKWTTAFKKQYTDFGCQID